MANRSTAEGLLVEEKPHVADTPRQAPRSPRRPADVRRKTSPRYYACVAILLLTAVGMQLVAGISDGHFRKSALPLKRPLDALDQAKLLPEYKPYRVQPPPLEPELIENLGTEEYLQWNLVDQQCDRADPTALVQLFITYHTGQPDLVPHNPEQCRAAAGMSLVGRGAMEVSVPGADGVEHTIPVSVLEFELPRREGLVARGGVGGGQRQFVAYFFYTNGRYVTSRTGVRLAVSNLWDRYAYYSKIEVSFSDPTLREFASREQTEAATRRLLPKLMPILWEDHYQSWEAIKHGTPPVILEPQR
jgi:hypothetical protein